MRPADSARAGAAAPRVGARVRDSRVTADGKSVGLVRWTALLPGQVLAGIGIGLATPGLASTAVGVVPPRLSGMASGANNTTRQLGLATGIAGLGAIFQSKIQSTLTPLVAGTPASSHVHELSRAVASGGTGRALQAVPLADRDKVVQAAHHAFVTSFTRSH